MDAGPFAIDGEYLSILSKADILGPDQSDNPATDNPWQMPEIVE